jgi:uncharacterized protein (TIGR00730 family)
MMPVKQICVYCSSSNLIAKEYFDDARSLGRAIAQKGITLVYGGGSSGLMGCIANEVLAYSGKVIGIIPDFMKQVEWAHTGVTELHVVGDMHERKKKFLDGTDALVALPGGCGTLEELLEVITLKRLGLYSKPIIIVNLNGFYDPLLEMLQRCIDQKFMNHDSDQMWVVVSRSEEVMNGILTAPSWHEDAIQRATLK